MIDEEFFPLPVALAPTCVRRCGVSSSDTAELVRVEIPMITRESTNGFGNQTKRSEYSS